MAALALALLLAAGPRQHLGPAPPAQVRKVVTLAPSLSEIVLALGAGDRLAGVTRFDDDARTAQLPRIGGYNDPQPEAVLQLKPDLVLAEPAPANRGPVETLARLGFDRNRTAVRCAVAYLKRKQDADGTWYGRWGCNYIYGTWLALRGLASAGEDLSQERYQRAGSWLRRRQNEDGGWGELPRSYDESSRKGIGPSTPSQTA